MAYSVPGSYFETCNCEAICPCRMVDGIRGGRSTYGICFGVLAWLVEDGRVGDVDVRGLEVALVVRYDDDEPGSPWTIVLHVDAAGDEQQRAALADVFLGRLGGPHVGVLPWVRKARTWSTSASTRSSSCRKATATAAGRRRGARARAPGLRRPTAVRCGIPGYDEPGRELVADELMVNDEPFAGSSRRTARSRAASPTRPSRGYLPP